MVRSWFSTERPTIHMALVALLLSVFLFSGIVHADDDYQAWTGEFMRMGAGARAMGMGNAYTAVDGDIYSSYFNPAGLSSMESRQMSMSFRYLSMDRQFRHFVFGNRIGPDADFAISWLNAGTEDLMGRDLNGLPTGSLRDSRNSFALTFSRSVNKWLSLGINTKMAFWKLAGEDAKAFGFDFGVIGRPVENLTAAFVVRDVNSRFTWQTDQWSKRISGADGQNMEKEDKFPVYWTGGLAYRMFDEKLLLSSTIESIEGNPLALDLGAAYDLGKNFIVRSGYYHYSSVDELNTGSITAGFSVKVTSSISFDYAYAVDGVEADNVHIIALLIDYGE